MQRPLRRNVGRRTVDEPRRLRQLHVEPAERRDEAVARRLAHRLLARPVAHEALAPLPQVEIRERRSLCRGQEFAREPINAHVAVEALDVDADAGVCRESPVDPDQRDAARVRDVEVDAGTGVQELGSPAHAAADLDRGRRDPERVAEQKPQHCTTHDPPPAKLVCSKPLRARLLGG